MNSNAITQPQLAKRRDQRNEAIRQRYAREYAKGFRSEVIFNKLADQFYLSVSTIECIVFERGHYKITSANSQP